jgi:hypothetical protein
MGISDGLYSMAEIIIQTVASIGFSLLKSWLDPVQYDGPQTNTTDKPSSQYGDSINKIFGYNRCSGTLIWAMDKVDRPYQSGGKGSTTTNHVYYGNFAYLIGHGELDIQTIYLNNKVWYSTAEDASQAQLKLNIERAKLFTFYRGTSTQSVDPRIQADLGVNRTTAYRDYAYIVFKDLPLTDYGNSFPLPSFEVVSSVDQVPQTQKRAGQIEGQSYTVTVTAYNNKGVQETITAQVPNAVWGARIMNVVPLTPEEGIRGEVQIYGKGYTQTIARGSRWGSAGFAGPSGIEIIDIQPPTLSVPSVEANATAATGAAQTTVSYAGQVFNYKIQWTRASDNSIQTSVIRGEAPFMVKLGDVLQDLETLLPTPPGVDYFSVDHPDNQLIGDRIYGVNGQVVYEPGNISNPLIEPLGILGIHGWQRVLTLPSAASVIPLPMNYAWNSVNGIETRITNLWSNTKLEVGATVAAGSYLVEVLDYVVESCGIPLDVCNFTALASVSIRGYRFASIKDGKSLLEELQKIYLFAFFRDGSKFVAEPYGTPLNQSIDYQDKFILNESGQIYSETILDPELVPLATELTYLSKDYHLRPSSQNARRYPSTVDYRLFNGSLPSVASKEVDIFKIQADAVLSNSEAITLVNKMFSIIAGRRRSYEWIWPLDMLAVSINKTFLLNLPYSSYQQSVIVESIDLGRNNSLVIKAFAYDAAFKDISLEAAATGTTVVLSGGATSVNFAVLDLPMWRTETHPAVLYFAAYAVNWSGAVIYASIDQGANFVNIGGIGLESTFGALVSSISSNISPDFIDYATTLRVKLKDGSANNFASISFESLMDNSSNLIAIGSEIAKFQTATLVGPSEYELSTLRRGLFGTWPKISTHQPGESVILLDSAVVSVAAPLDQLNQVLLARIVPSGQTQSTSATTITPRGNSIKPLPVVNIRSEYSVNSIKVYWSRVARKNSSWVSYLDTPLGEITEKYSIDIYTSTGNFKRTIVTSVPEFTYSTADRVTDIGNDPTFQVEVFQLGDTIGRGFGAKSTITV